MWFIQQKLQVMNKKHSIWLMLNCIKSSSPFMISIIAYGLYNLQDIWHGGRIGLTFNSFSVNQMVVSQASNDFSVHLQTRTVSSNLVISVY